MEIGWSLKPTRPLAAEALAGTRSYKSDDKSKQTPERRDARCRIVGALTGERCKDKYGLVTILLL